MTVGPVLAVSGEKVSSLRTGLAEPQMKTPGAPGVFAFREWPCGSAFAGFPQDLTYRPVLGLRLDELV